eukprot:TRINITY_DN8146_c0_g6_i1.p1 TRINITY_DN8146_c0_g6~~TRINITY_DN8146_c0_g6_i1.p1  ORF type:complete len:518 (-),score=65.08 TRINITY_DN8146_c0_g6_i1:663-2216(-)
MEEMKKKLMPLMQSPELSVDWTSSYKVTDCGTINFLSRSCGEYNINPKGLLKRVVPATPEEAAEGGVQRERQYKIGAHEVICFNAVGSGACGTVRKAIHLPTHRIIALKNIKAYEKEKRSQLLNEIRALCEAPKAQGLVEFFGAFFSPDCGQISIALEYVDGGSLDDIVKSKQSIPEPVLSIITCRVLQGLDFLHRGRRLVHRDIKPTNLLMSLAGEPKITDFGISAGLENTLDYCATFVGTFTYMSPERLRNEQYSYPADIWSLGLTVLELATGVYPYDATKGPFALMMEVMQCASPSPSPERFSPEFISFVNSCLIHDPDQRPTANQLLSHQFIKKYVSAQPEIVTSFMQGVFNPIDRFKDLADMLTVHYYVLFDGKDDMWGHVKSLYRPISTFLFETSTLTGADAIFETLAKIRSGMQATPAGERLVHMITNLECCPSRSSLGVAVRVSGDIVVGSQFVSPSDFVLADPRGNQNHLQLQGSIRRGGFNEQFMFEPSEETGGYWISCHECHFQVN